MEHKDKIEIKYAIDFVIADDITWTLKITEPTEQIVYPAKSPAPAHQRPVIMQLVALKSIPKKLSLRIQYVVVDGEIIIAYDSIRADQEPLTSAVIERDAFVKLEDTEFIKELTKIFGIKGYLLSDCWKCAGFIDHEIDISKYEKKPGQIDLSATMSTIHRRHPYGELASVFMLPQFPSEKEAPSTPIALAELTTDNGQIDSRELSDTVWSNLEALEGAMAAPNNKIILVQGEPGSGKEGFAKAVHFGSKRRGKADKNDGPVIRSIAGMKMEQFKRELFGEDIPGGIHVEGLIEKAAGGTLILDEFDKLDREADGAYAELLRVWEAEEYMPLNGRTVYKVRDLNWVVAGAFTSIRKTSDLPPDIWSRFSSQIAIQSPIWTEDKKKRKNYVKAIILSTMLRLALNHSKIEGESFDKTLHGLCKTRGYNNNILRRMMFNGTPLDETGDRLRPSTLIVYFAVALAQYVGSYLRHSCQESADPGPLGNLKKIEFWTPDGYDPNNLCAQAKFQSISELMPGNCVVKSVEYYDSIRSILQASKIIFERLYEYLIRGKPASDLKKQDIEEDIRDILRQAFETVDLARTGYGPAHFVERNKFNQWKGIAKAENEENIIKPKLIAQIAESLKGPIPPGAVP
jgi:hypothetical protein